MELNSQFAEQLEKINKKVLKIEQTKEDHTQSIKSLQTLTKLLDEERSKARKERQELFKIVGDQNTKLTRV